MTKGTRGRRGISSRQCRPTPYPLRTHDKKHSMHQKTQPKLVKKDWEDATCSVCMECPHNAVLLLCSSHNKGCRPYMCGTSSRYSNCLDQYHKAHAKVSSGPLDNTPMELVCPLCRGQVKGWTVVEPAREHLNAKRRGCMQDGCPFMGTFKELRKHVRAEHPCARPREVDPAREQRWRRLEREREQEDVMSTIRSSTPGAIFFGDYVIEGGNYSDDEDDDDLFDGSVGAGVGGIDRNLMSVFLFLQAFGSAGRVRQDREPGEVVVSGDGFEYSDEDGEDGDNGTSFARRLRRQGRVVLGRSGRRRRHREAGGARI
ncbi:Protein of unknown function (DUF1644 [Striga hermonthica]|uniref:Uncharacterized protein n=1 Tax=Striga hermonthica TaxID=68872 RepID=A0A9N7N704_STRHE|nr:Protein of unknown function (DUF1644 [Striga hermonthica]